MLDFLDLYTTDPAWNLAAEQYVFDELPRDRAYAMLWQNENAVIIGRHQNTRAEINEAYVQAHGVQVVRRLSGGGAVYHDLGNLNYTFITDAGDSRELDFARFCGAVVRTLARFGITAEMNGRNDITIGGAKFSGNAQYVKEGRVMHHGTILFEADAEKVEQVLRVDPSKIAGKGVRSVRSRITTVKAHLTQPVTLPEFRAALKEQILRENPGREITLGPEAEEVISRLAARYRDPDWNWGQSPAGSLQRRRRFPGCGLIEAHIETEHDRIRAIRFTGDFFSFTEPDALVSRLAGCRLLRGDLEEALKEIRVSEYFHGLEREDLIRLLAGEEEDMP